MTDVCLNCTLWVCDDTSSECAFTQIVRTAAKRNEYSVYELT